MTEKQLYDIINMEEPRRQSVTYKGIPCTARTCVTKLNRLSKENEQLKLQLDYIQSSITEAIQHSKTGLEQKALKKVIEDYNEYMLGHLND